MGKISLVMAKYIVHAKIHVDGVVDKPDIIGAIFGQSEGLLGADLELRELQRSGRVGRIEVSIDTKAGKTTGTIIVPSSLDKAETALVASAIETIERIGPCNAEVNIESVEDVRVSKRNQVVNRAKELLRKLAVETLPSSQEMTEEVEHSVRMMNITEYGRNRLPAGPAVEEAEEIILVEGRADVLNLLKHGFNNVVALNGTSAPPSIKELCKEKVVTLFVDGDRGGDLIIKEVTSIAEIDFVIKAPDGKEVEELTKKEIHKALRGKVAVEQVKMDLVKEQKFQGRMKEQRPYQPRFRLTDQQREAFKKMLDDLVGTKGAYIVDDKLNILGKVPVTEVASTVRNLARVFAVILDGAITKQLVMALERTPVRYLVGMEIAIHPSETRKIVLTENNL